MRRGPWQMHTHWRWRPADPIRHIYLYRHRETKVWMVFVSSAQTEWRRDYPEYTAAWNQCQQMIERNGGQDSWQRTGPDMSGNRFD